MPLDPRTEANTLRAMLGLPSEPVYLDIKPGPLTDAERDQFTRRLAEVKLRLSLAERFRGQEW